MSVRYCGYCLRPVPSTRRQDAGHCSDGCKVDATRIKNKPLTPASLVELEERIARAKHSFDRLTARADYVRRIVCPDTVSVLPVETKPETGTSTLATAPTTAALPKVWKPSPAQFTGILTLDALDEMPDDEIPYACEYDADASVRAFTAELRTAACTEDGIASIVDNLRAYLRTKNAESATQPSAE